MARHLGEITESDQRSLHRALVRWCARAHVAVMLTHDYSLLRAVDDEVERARLAWRRAQAATD